MIRFLSLLLIFSTQFVMAACETKREIFIENKQTKVWKTTICPQQRIPFHTHEFARIIIPMQNGQLKVVYRNGKKQIIKLEKQTPLYLSQAQGIYSHQDINIGTKPIEVTVIELRNL